MLLGDPGLAKSQLLKFVALVAPTGVSFIYSTATLASPAYPGGRSILRARAAALPG